jgi:predicted ArsR family transcriptional regulator
VSAGQLAEALGRDPEEVRGELDRLYADGAVLRTGSGERARYRAAAG